MTLRDPTQSPLPNGRTLADVLAAHQRWLLGDRLWDDPDRASLDGAHLVGASLVGASLVGARLDRAHLDGASLVGASLVGAHLVGASLVRARLDGASLDGASLVGASLDRAHLVGARLDRASLVGASLVRARLDGASLVGASLDRASLVGASLDRAHLDRARLDGASLVRATMPDGRKWEDYRADHLDGLCTTAEVRERALAAWGKHKWQDCPMHAAHGWASVSDAPADLRLRVACWVACYDAGLLEAPSVIAAGGAA